MDNKRRNTVSALWAQNEKHNGKRTYMGRKGCRKGAQQRGREKKKRNRKGQRKKRVHANEKGSYLTMAV